MRLAVLLATISLCSPAQHVGGIPPGHGGSGPGWGHPTPMPPFNGIGRNPWWGGYRGSGFGPFGGYGSSPFWYGTPLCASPLFPLAPNCDFGGDAGGSGYDQPPPSNPSPTINLMVMPAPPPMPVPIPVPVANGATADDVSNPPETASVADHHQTLPTIPTASGPYPPLIVLKTGGMYSITKYWVKGKTLYFETTAGDTLYAPLAQFDRMIPGSK